MVSLKNKFLFFSKLYSESCFWHFSIFFRFIQKSYSKLPLSTHWKSFSALWLFMNHQMTHWLSKRTFSKSLRFQHNFTGVSGIKRKWVDGRALQSRDDHRRITGRLSFKAWPKTWWFYFLILNTFVNSEYKFPKIVFQL